MRCAQLQTVSACQSLNKGERLRAGAIHEWGLADRPPRLPGGCDQMWHTSVIKIRAAPQRARTTACSLRVLTLVLQTLGEAYLLRLVCLCCVPCALVLGGIVLACMLPKSP
eukprot:366289-Chlamydomonas_euryale.AAC.6